MNATGIGLPDRPQATDFGHPPINTFRLRAYADSSMFQSIRERRWARTSDDVPHLTGQLPTSFGDLLEVKE
jgi:hypothetical protein